MSAQNHRGRQTIRGKYAGNYYPEVHAEIDRKLELDGISGGRPFDVSGSIYGRDLVVRGPGCVHGPMVIRGDVKLHAFQGRGVQAFQAGMFTSGNVLSQSPAKGLPQSMAGDLRGTKRIIRGDIVARNVRLDNTLVFGNIQGATIDVSSCLVFGAVIATNQARIRASTILHYHAPRIEFEGPCMMLSAMGESVDKPVFAPFEDETGKIWPANIRFYPVLRAAGFPFLFWRPWKLEELGPLGLLFQGVDWRKVPVESSPDEPTEARRYVLSVAGRALDFGSLSHHLAELAELLRIGFEFDHYSPKNKLAAVKRFKSLPDEERFVMETVCRLELPGSHA